MSNKPETPNEQAAEPLPQAHGSVWVVSFRDDKYRNDGIHAVFADESDARQCVDRMNDTEDGAVFYAKCWPVTPNDQAHP